jgi:2-polyprenyl-3-methyl-5-hydroxy-6-metoxy-1,4-benzoquinol methylase
MHLAENMIRGTRGYAENAVELIGRYESLSFAYKHETVLHLIPSTPSKALDIGAGTGADAAWLAAQGHRVLAVEPTSVLREYGLKHHASPLVEWVSDALPRLERLAQRKHEFSLIMLTAVWMHLDEQERRVAMPVVASLLAPDGVIIMALRHGPVPMGRVMFAVSAEETVALAEVHGLRCLLNVSAESRLAANREAGITWSRVAFTQASSA